MTFVSGSAAWRRLGPRVAAVAGGVATVTAFAPLSWWPFAFLGPALLMGLWWRSASPREAFWLGFWWAAGLFVPGTYWLYTAIHVFGLAPVWLTLFLMIGLVALMSSYYGLLGHVAVRWLRPATPVGALAGVPCAWLFVEWLRGWLFSGFPWLQLGYSQSDTPLAALAPVVGLHGVTLATLLVAATFVVGLRLPGRPRLAALAVLAFTAGAGILLGDHGYTRPAGAPFEIALVQGAIPQDLKWQEDNRAATLDLYRDMTQRALGARLIVWPEAALPVLAHEAEDYLNSIWRDARRAGSDVILGLLRFDFGTDRFYNGMVAFSDRATWYYKRRLVPFGEFFPVPKFVRGWMRLMSLPYVDMSPGAEQQLPLVAAGIHIAPTICYEDAYGAEQLGMLGEAELLVNVTNNAWFGDSTAPHQQLQMARFRAREAGRYLARATSNGITAIIAPDGRIVARARQFRAEILRGEVTPMTGLTPYARTGNAPVLGLAGLGILLSLVCGWRCAARSRQGRLSAAARTRPTGS
jgi:apolipoprotein N-acyltransferase